MTAQQVGGEPARVPGASAAYLAAGMLRSLIEEIDAGATSISLDGGPPTPEDLAVLRVQALALAAEMYGRGGLRSCERCACIEADACPGGCSWLPGPGNVCSRHVELVGAAGR